MHRRGDFLPIVRIVTPAPPSANNGNAHTAARWQGFLAPVARCEVELSWNGAPYDFDYPSLTGNIVLEAAKGQFVKLEPGIGKLLGILSLQSLPRRAALDFRDVFSDGYAFDEIVGAIKINRGIASMEVDGEPQAGPDIPLNLDGKAHHVRIVLGERETMPDRPTEAEHEEPAQSR